MNSCSEAFSITSAPAGSCADWPNTLWPVTMGFPEYIDNFGHTTVVYTPSAGLSGATQLCSCQMDCVDPAEAGSGNNDGYAPLYSGPGCNCRLHVVVTGSGNNGGAFIGVVSIFRLITDVVPIVQLGLMAVGSASVDFALPAGAPPYKPYVYLGVGCDGVAHLNFKAVITKL